MKTKRTVLKIDSDTPGTEIAAETAAAMAASAIVFRPSDHKYARRLLNKAKLVRYIYTNIGYIYCMSISFKLLLVFLGG